MRRKKAFVVVDAKARQFTNWKYGCFPPTKAGKVAAENYAQYLMEQNPLIKLKVI